MKYVYLLGFLLFTLSVASVAAEDSIKDNSISQEAMEVTTKCNLEARNFLVNGNLGLVEELCTEAINVIEKSPADREYLINPMMNLAFAYTLAGQFDSATPLYNRARDIREQLYGPDSRKLKEIDDMIKRQEEMQKQPRKQ